MYVIFFSRFLLILLLTKILFKIAHLYNQKSDENVINNYIKYNL